jgi:superfamily I DNA/RNA helicase
VPEVIRNKLFDVVTTPDYAQVLTNQPSFILNDVDDLLRYKEGDLMGFLLKLSPEQEKFVTWGMSASGPVLLKGGPGTGKTTIAIYRTRELLRDLRTEGVEQPRILFTTYTKALSNYIHQLMRQALGDDVEYVDVVHFDKLVSDINMSQPDTLRIAKGADKKRALDIALGSVELPGNALQQKAQRATLEWLGHDYLLAELDYVITARQLKTEAEYLKTPRPGRHVALGASQRAAIWAVYQGYLTALHSLGLTTFQLRRDEAEAAVRAGAWSKRYDAVVVDEAQDLDPSVLRMLVELCHNPNRFFLAADANQSIFGSGFAWTDVHEDLKFKGRTNILRTNYRSTRQIGIAAAAYLAGGELDTEDAEEASYTHDGPQPATRVTPSAGVECDLLARFITQAARQFQLGRGACAIFAPTNDAGKSLAAELTARGVKATFMTGDDIELKGSQVKVLSLKSAKGLEFPIVALAGFTNGQFPVLLPRTSDEERDEVLARERRTMYVGMTRAMRALLVCVPAENHSLLLTGFSPEYWNCGSTES